MGDRAALARRWLTSTNAATASALVGAALLAPTPAARPGFVLALLLFVGSSVHVASTAWLGTIPSARDCARRRPVRFVLAPLACVGVGAVLGEVTDTTTLSLVLAGFFAWQFFHFAKQNVGMVALAASSIRVAPLRTLERRCVIAAGVAGVVGLLAHPALLQLDEHVDVQPLFAAAAVAFVAVVAIGCVAFARRPAGDRPARVGITYGLALGFSAPIFLFASPYAAVAGMTIAHGLQYLGIVGWIALGPATRRRRTLSIVSLVNVALLGGAALAAMSHLHGDPGMGRVVFGAYLGLVSAHFVVDAGLWRFSHPTSRRFMADALPALVAQRSSSSALTVTASTSSADIECH